jgi:hypothetical protein
MQQDVHKAQSDLPETLSTYIKSNLLLSSGFFFVIMTKQIFRSTGLHVLSPLNMTKWFLECHLATA